MDFQNRLQKQRACRHEYVHAAQRPMMESHICRKCGHEVWVLYDPEKVEWLKQGGKTEAEITGPLFDNRERWEPQCASSR